MIHAKADDMKSDPAGNAGDANRLRRDRKAVGFAAGFAGILKRRRARILAGAAEKFTGFSQA